MTFRPRAVLSVLGLSLGVALALWVVYVARQVLTWVLVSAFLALALNPAVEWLQRRRGIRRRAAAAAVIYVGAIAALVGFAFLIIPVAVDQVRGLADATPHYVHDLTAGRGPLGFLQRDYHVVDRVRDALHGGGTAKLAGGAGTVVSITKGVLTAIVAVVTIAFMTFFMIVEGPTWADRLFGLLATEAEPRWRAVGRRIYQAVSRLRDGQPADKCDSRRRDRARAFILGVPYALALGLLVAILDLIPLAGATVAGVIVITIGFLTSVTAGVAVAVFFVLYQQLENHLLQPLVYRRTVRLSPLTVLIAVLVGAEVAGVLGALGAIPIAGAIQIVLIDWRDRRRERAAALAQPDGSSSAARAASAPSARA